MPRNLHMTADFWRLRPATRETLLVLWMAADNAGGIEGSPGALHRKLNTPGTTKRLLTSLEELSDAGHVVIDGERIQLARWRETLPSRMLRDFAIHSDETESKQRVVNKNPAVAPKCAIHSDEGESKRALAKDNPAVGKSGPSRARVVDPSDQLEEENRTPPLRSPPGDDFKSRKEVFSVWKEKFGKSRAKFNSGDARDRRIQTRLKRWTLEELVQCVEGYAMDPWRHEAPVRNELSTLLRNDMQVETGLELFNTGGNHGRAEKHTTGIDGKVRGRANRTIGYGDEDRSSPSGLRNGRGNPLRDGDAGRDEVSGDGPSRAADGLPF